MSADIELWKLTDRLGQTRGKTQWGPGIRHEVASSGTPKLCTASVIHAYRDPLLAVLMDPCQGAYGPEARLWLARGTVAVEDGTKVGCLSLTTVEERPLPAVTTKTRVRFGIRCAWEVTTDEAWRTWAGAWLSGEDQTARAAAEAAWAAEAAARAEAAATAEAKLDLVVLAHQAFSEES